MDKTLLRWAENFKKQKLLTDPLDFHLSLSLYFAKSYKDNSIWL